MALDIGGGGSRPPRKGPSKPVKKRSAAQDRADSRRQKAYNERAKSQGKSTPTSARQDLSGGNRDPRGPDGGRDRDRGRSGRRNMPIVAITGAGQAPPPSDRGGGHSYGGRGGSNTFGLDITVSGQNPMGPPPPPPPGSDRDRDERARNTNTQMQQTGVYQPTVYYPPDAYNPQRAQNAEAARYNQMAEGMYGQPPNRKLHSALDREQFSTPGMWDYISGEAFGYGPTPPAGREEYLAMFPEDAMMPDGSMPLPGGTTNENVQIPFQPQGFPGPVMPLAPGQPPPPPPPSPPERGQDAASDRLQGMADLYDAGLAPPELGIPWESGPLRDAYNYTPWEAYGVGDQQAGYEFSKEFRDTMGYYPWEGPGNDEDNLAANINWWFGDGGVNDPEAQGPQPYPVEMWNESYFPGGYEDPWAGWGGGGGGWGGGGWGGGGGGGGYSNPWASLYPDLARGI